MYRNIVVPLDGSETAEQVLKYVRDLVQGRTVTVHLVSVAPLSASSPMSAAAQVRMYTLVVSRADFEAQTQERDRIESELRNYLNGVAITLAHGSVTSKVEVRFGEPAEEILTLQSEVKADLIAMCTHGRTGLARWAYGSVAEKVMRHAECPVLLVRAKK